MMQGHFWVIAFLFSLVTVFLLYSIILFRRKPGEEGEGEYIHGIVWLEWTWTLAPLLLVIYFAQWGVKDLIALTTPQPNEMTIRAVGFQWGWKFEYPELGVTTSDLFLPLDRDIRMELETLDVLHSFWIPEFRVKQDLVPVANASQLRELRFRPTVLTNDEPYKVRCAEICGFNHAYMLADVHVVPEGELEDTIAKASALPADIVERGAIWYDTFACASCHSLDGSELVGPSWQGIYERETKLADGTTVIADDEYLRNSILNPNGQIVEGYPPNQMPVNFGDQFAQKQAELAADNIESDIIVELIEYMKTLE